MRDEAKTKKQLIQELDRLRLRIDEPEASEAAHKLEQAALRASEEKYRTLVENAPVGISTTAPDGTAIERNRAVTEMHGYESREEFLKVPAQGRYYDPKDRERFLKLLEEKGVVRDFEVRLKRKDSSTFWGALTSIPFKSESREQLILTITQDISQRKEAETSLREAELLYRALFEQCPDGILLIDPDTALPVEFNTAVCNQLGYSPEEFARVRIFDFEALETVEVTREHIARIRERGEDEFITKHRTKKGEIRNATVKVKTIEVSGRTLLLCIFRDVTEQKQAQESLAKSEARFRNLVENAPIGMSIVSPDGHPIERNKTLQQMYGYDSKEEFMSSPASERYHNPNDRDRFIEALKRGPISDFQVRMKRKDGTLFWVSLSSIPQVTDAREQQIITVVQDITERKNAEDELKLRAEVLDSATDAIYLRGMDGRIVYVNDAMSKTYGYSKDELIGMNTRALVSPKLRHQFGMRVSEAKEKGGVVFESEHLRKNGTIFPAEVHFRIIESDGKEYVLDVVRDITRRKQIEDALRASEEKFRNLVENAPVGIGITTFDGKPLLRNRAIAEMYGYTDEELLKEPVTTRYLKPEDRELFLELAKEGPVKDFELQMRRKDGSKFWVSLAAIPQKTETGDGFITIVQDITERKRAQEGLEKLYRQEVELRQQLETEIKRRANFMRALVHEIKTPLTPVLASSELLLDELKEEPYVALAKNIYRGAVNLNNRIDELLDLARGEVGMLRLNREPLALATLLREIVDYMLPSASSKGLTLRSEIPSTLPAIQGDIQRLSQVLMNLISNSIKFTDAGGTIILRARKESDQIVVEVEDTGQGMSEEDQDRLFQPYHRLEVDREHMTGLGLGLALCKMFVELHGGQISVRSKKGTGSVFSFSLPVQEKGENDADKAGDKP